MLTKKKSRKDNYPNKKSELTSMKKSSSSHEDGFIIPGAKLGTTGEGATKWLESVRSTATQYIGKSGKQLGNRGKLHYPMPDLIPYDNLPENMSKSDNDEDSSYVCKSLHPQELDQLEQQARLFIGSEAHAALRYNLHQ